MERVKDLMGAAEVAAEIRIHPSRVRRLANQHGIGRRLGARVWLFTPADLEAMRLHAHGRPGRPARQRSTPKEPDSTTP